MPTEQRGHVERVGQLPHDVFERDYLLRGCPVVMTGALAGWPALLGWTPDSLAGRVGERQVEVAGATTG